MLWWSISHILLFMEIIIHWLSINAETFVRRIKFVLFRTCSLGRVFTTFGLLLCPIRKLLPPNLLVVIVHIFFFVVDSLNWWNHGVRRTWYKFVTFQVHFVTGRLFLFGLRWWYFHRILRCVVLLHAKCVKSDLCTLEHIVFNFFRTQWFIAEFLVTILRYYLYFFVSAIVLWEFIIIILIDKVYITAFFAICIIAITTPSLHNVVRWAEIYESFCGGDNFFGALVPATELSLNGTSFKGILENAAIVIDIFNVPIIIAALLPILIVHFHDRPLVHLFVRTEPTVLMRTYRSQNLTLLSILNIAIFTWIAMKGAQGAR